LKDNLRTSPNQVGCNTLAYVIYFDNPGLSSTYRKLKLPRSFEEMQKHGVKITSYSTTEEV
jgi:hypothetical protein